MSPVVKAVLAPGMLGAMRLEDLRGPHVGDVAVWLGGDEYFTASFHEHAQQAHWHTINCLQRLSGSPVDGAATPVIGVVEWWRTIESLIALLYLVATRESAAGLRPDQRRVTDGQVDALQKWKAVTNWFSDGLYSPPSAVTGRVTELRDFRNSFEHTSRTDSRDRRHSRLAATPAEANEVDLMEAMAICVSACEVVRGVVPGLDLMPQVVVPADDSFLFESIDIVARDVTVPAFQRCLEARGLTTDFAMYEAPPNLSGKALGPLGMVVRHADAHDLPLPVEAADVAAAFRVYGAEHPRRPAAGQFGLPAYMTR